MGDPWVQSIGGSLIAALIVSLAVFALRHRREALFSINVSTVIFAFGNILEPAAKYVLEGPEAVKDVFLAVSGDPGKQKLSKLQIILMTE
jgi:hypothetical protein